LKRSKDEEIALINDNADELNAEAADVLRYRDDDEYRDDDQCPSA